MAIVEKQIPHEFLFRWDDAGNKQGAHIVDRIAYVDDTTNTEVASKFGDPQPVDLTNVTLLSQISADINQATLTDNTSKDAQIASLNSQLAAANTNLQAAQAAQQQAESDKAAALAQVSQLQAQIAALQPQTVNGVPQEVTKRQAVQALINTGNISKVQPAIDAIADPVQRETMQNEWSNSTTFQRQRPTLIQMGTAIGLTSADLDNLFKLAATL